MKDMFVKSGIHTTFQDFADYKKGEKWGDSFLLVLSVVSYAVE